LIFCDNGTGSLLVSCDNITGGMPPAR